MKVEIIFYVKTAIDSDFLNRWIKAVLNELKKNKIHSLKKQLVVAFISTKEMKKLNYQYRKKPSPTDVLSFEESPRSSCLGELALCPYWIRKNSVKKKVSFKEEIAYITLHGLLHLFGFDHEKSRTQAQKMYRLQDDIFKNLKKRGLLCL